MHGGRWGREVQHALLLVKNLHSNAGSVASILQGQIRYVRKTKRHEIHFFQLLNIILFAGSLFTSELPHKVTALQVANVFFTGFSIEGGTRRLIAAYFGIYSRLLCV